MEWDPIPEGVIVAFDVPVAGSFSMQLPMTSVREFRDDMEEAYMLSRGNHKLEVMASHVLQYDKVYVAGNVLMVSDVLSDSQGTVLQFGDHQTEMLVPSDQQITVWRPVE